jgi:transcriptional regulator with XRE-family HTH domain
MPIQDTVRRLRLEAGLSYLNLAAAAQVSHSYLQRLEAGQATNPGRNLLISVGVALRLDVPALNELLEEAGHMPLTPRATVPPPRAQTAHLGQAPP